MPLLWFCLAFILGIAAAPHFPFPVFVVWIGAVFFLFAALVERHFLRNRSHPLLSNVLFRIPFTLLFFAFFLGLGRFHLALPDSKFLALPSLNEKTPTAVRGIISSDPERANRYTSVILSSEEINDGIVSVALDEKIYVTLPPGISIHYGDFVQLQGQIESTFSVDLTPIFSSQGRNGIMLKMEYPEVKILATNQGNPVLAAIYRIRERALELIFDMIPSPESGVLAGILLGIGSSIPTQLWNGYRASGIAHILVISGFNISIIAVLLFRVLRKRLRMDRAILLAILLTVLYTLLVGADTPVVRAAIMAMISLPAAYFGRRSLGIHNLSIAAALMLLINPFQLWDISFQLSFLATLALLVMVDPIISFVNKIIFKNKRTENDERNPLLIELIVTTLCASFSVFPILFKLTGTLSLSSIPANILVAPVQPLIMALGGIAVMIGIVSPVLGGLIGKAVWPFIAYCNQIALRFSIHPSATIYLQKWVYYASLALVSGTLTYFSVKEITETLSPHLVETDDVHQ